MRSRIALLVVTCILVGGSITAGVVYLILDEGKADTEPVEEIGGVARVADEKAREGVAKAQRTAVLAKRLTKKLADTKAEVVTVTRDVRAAGIEGDPGESIEGPGGDTGEQGDPGETVVGPEGPPPTELAVFAAVASFCAADACDGPQGIQGETGPSPTAAEIVAALIAFFSSDEGEEQLRDWITALECTAPPPDFLVSCAVP